MKKKRLVSLMLAGLVTTSIIGCGGEDKKVESKAGTKDPITFTLFLTDAKEDIPFTDDVSKKIEELTGVTLKIEHPVAGDTQAVPLMIASGEYPDLIYPKEDISKLIDAGGVITLDDMIEKKGTNLKALYGDQLNRLRNSIEDPQIYTVGTYGVSDKIFEPSGALQLQHEALKELGYPEIKTIYDYEEAIKTYIEKNPTTEDGEKRIGMTLLGSDWRWLITVGNSATAAAGYPDDGQFIVNPETSEAIHKYTSPELKEYFKWLNHMSDIGLLDPESFTQKEDVYKAKISSGRVVGLSDVLWNYKDATTSLLGEGKAEKTYASLPIVIDEKTDKSQALKESGFGGGWGVSISSSCKDPERAFEFLDWLASDEAQVLLNWGIEGKHYIINEEGKREFLPEVQKQKNEDPKFQYKTGIGLYTDSFPSKGIGALDSNGDSYLPITLENIKANYNEAEKETLKAYGAESWVELYPQPEELGKSKHGAVWKYTIPSTSNMAMILKKINDYGQQAITQAILGKPEEFDKNWDEIQAKIKSFGVDELNEGITQMVKDKIELWK